MINLEEMNLTDLKALAKEHNIKNISKLKKEELIAVLKQIITPSLNADKEDENDEDIMNENNNHDEIKKVTTERQYDENGEPIVDYKLTNDGDEIVEGILDIMPDGYGFIR